MTSTSPSCGVITRHSGSSHGRADRSRTLAPVAEIEGQGHRAASPPGAAGQGRAPQCRRRNRQRTRPYGEEAGVFPGPEARERAPWAGAGSGKTCADPRSTRCCARAQAERAGSASEWGANRGRRHAADFRAGRASASSIRAVSAAYLNPFALLRLGGIPGKDGWIASCGIDSMPPRRRRVARARCRVRQFERGLIRWGLSASCSRSHC